MDFALCLTLDILGSLFNAFFLVHDSENPKFGKFQSKRLTTQRSFNR
jgi:hypothetical protein